MLSCGCVGFFSGHEDVLPPVSSAVVSIAGDDWSLDSDSSLFLIKGIRSLKFLVTSPVSSLDFL